MPENICNSVTFEPPDYDSPAVLDVLVRALTGRSKAAFEKDISDNLFGKYDKLYRENVKAPEPPSQ
ncbi:MAG: hypothetical protein K5695_06400 [Oscillospiraceae bacterium]|nr:hypothetical protein [Oscillospiraceae bacterium]